MIFQIAEQYFHIIVIGWTFLALISLPRLLALYQPDSNNSHVQKNQIGLVAPGMIAIAVFMILFLLGNHAITTITWLFFAFWIIHYTLKIFFNLLNPIDYETQAFNTKTHSIILLINAILNGFCLGWLWPAYAISWTTHSAFFYGSLLICIGLIIQIVSNIKLYLAQNSKATSLNSGFHKLVFCPGYFGEILQWGGFALTTWSTPATAMFCWMLTIFFAQTTAQKYNYLSRFHGLPPARKAFIPFLF